MDPRISSPIKSQSSLLFTDGGDRENRPIFSNDLSTNASVNPKRINLIKNDMELDAMDQEGEIDLKTAIISEMKKPTARVHNILGSNVNTVNQQGVRVLKGTEKAHRKQEINAGEEEEQDEPTILPPTNTRLSRRSKKISEMSTGDGGLASSEGCINEDQEIASTLNTPSSSASSSRFKIISLEKLYKNNYRFNVY